MSEKLLVICEKPSAARNFSEALGGRSGTWKGKPYVIVNLFGHVLENPEPMLTAREEYRDIIGKFSQLAGLPWKPEYFDFNTKEIVRPILPDGRIFTGPEESVASIQKYLKMGYIPVIATDIDDMCEGDVIGHEVLNYLGYTGKRYREHHVDEEKSSILKAFDKMFEVNTDDKNYLMGTTRANCDYLTQSLTRMATMTVQSKGVSVKPIPMGRLKSPIIVFLGDQIKAIRDYQPSSVWESRYQLGELILTNPDVERYPTEQEWTAGDLPDRSNVRKVKEVPGKTAPPKPLNFDQLSGIMKDKHGMRLDVFEKMTQKMYENGVLSYPRTSEKHLTLEQFNNALPNVNTLIGLLSLPVALFSHRTPRKTHVKNDGAHGALHPGVNVPKTLDSLDDLYGVGASKIYKLVTERFLMMFLEDTEWVKHEYETTDTPVPFKGFLKIITKQGVTNPEEDEPIATSLPNLNEMADLYAHEVKSRKPDAPTLTFLLKELEKHNIGTPATRVSTLKELIGNETRPIIDGKVLSLSDSGNLAYISAKGTIIGSKEGTALIQDLMKKVQSGEITKESAIKQFSDVLAKDVLHLRDKHYALEQFDFKPASGRVSGVFRGKPVSIFDSYGSHKFTDSELTQLFNGETIDISVKSKEGKLYDISGKLDEVQKDGKTHVKFVRVRNDLVSGTFNGVTVQIKNSFMNHTFTEQELKCLFNGETIHIVTTKDDKSYNVKGKLGIDDFTGKKEVRFIPEFENKRNPNDYYTGIWKGREVTFKREFMKYRFTDKECENLCKGLNIAFEGTTNSGTKRMVEGALGLEKYKGKQYLKFVPDFNKK